MKFIYTITMIIKRFISGPLDNNNYLVIDESTNEGVLIDCSEISNKIDSYISNNKINLKYILLTHAHFDHILGVDFFRQKYKTSVLLHKDDKDLLNMLNSFIPKTKIPTIDTFFDENLPLQIGNIDIKIIHTPGHSNGSCCFLIKDNLFSGDTLFYKGYGRTDLPFGNENNLFRSLTKLFLLPNETKVFPGHGFETSIKQEKSIY